MEAKMCEGISVELEGISLGDKRLNQRSKMMIETLAADPQASINAACDGWAETQAAYRFFENSNVTPDRILKPHIQATKQRINNRPRKRLRYRTPQEVLYKHRKIAFQF